MTDDRRLARDPIAIVGMSGLLPKAHNHVQFWQNIVDGVDCIEEVPPSRWKLDDYYDADPSTPDKTYSRRGAFLPDVDFDPLEFGLPPNQLEVTSTMQTLSLGVARDLLIDAGAVGSDWYDAANTGVVLGTTGPVPLMHPLAARLSTPVLLEAARSVGLSERDADAIAQRFVSAFAPWEENSFPGLLANVVAGRVANRLGLGGMNCTVDAACAASLAAIRTAIAELQDRRADMMITGGVDTENTIFIYMCFSKVGALSPTGRISPFSTEANGTLLGEGITMLALRRLADARRDGNRIYAVIRGLGSSSDGRSKSIYAPRAEGQRVALDRAYRDAECSPADVELIEAHATGTAVGDRTELTALSGLLAEASTESRFAALGSVKSQIGHTKGAAGTASVMKLALALHQKVLPGTINVGAPNTDFEWGTAPFYVNTRTRPWIRDPQRPVRRAAASAMGFGGTNFHLVLEEADVERSGLVLHQVPRAQLWHAADAVSLAEAVRSAAPGDGGDIPEGHARIGFVVIDDEQAEHLRELAAEELLRNPDAQAWDHPEGVYYRAAALPERKVGALFAGQGSQYVDMGSTAALNNPPVGAAFDTANAAFAEAPRRLASVVFPAPAFGEAEQAEQEILLRRTDFAQPAIGALAVGQFRVLNEFGLRPDGLLGHSFGELTALWASGAVSTDDYFTLARARGAAMVVPEGEDAGAMTAVGATREAVGELIAGVEDVWICNHNAPDQVVVGGGAAGIAEVTARAGERGIATRDLPVSGAFHTPYVAHAVDRFAAAVAEVPIGAPAVPVYANSADAEYGEDMSSNRAVLTGQLSKPVEFAAALNAMRADGCTVFVEFGPKQILTSLVRRTLGDEVIAIATDSGPIGDGDLTLKRAAVRLAVLGFDIRGINRYAAPEPVAPSRRGMTVTLSAPEYVPDTRRAAHAAALEDGYVVSALASQPVAAQSIAGSVTPVPAAVAQVSNGVVPHDDIAPVAEPAPVRSAEPPESFVSSQPSHRDAAAADYTALDSALVQHLDTHRQYLDGQLDLARTLAGALAQGGLDEGTVRAIEAVKEHGIAISDSHSHASAVLAQLAGLESGVEVTPSHRVSAVTRPAPRALAASPVVESPVRQSVPAVAAYAPEPVQVAVAPAVPATNGTASVAGVSDKAVSNGVNAPAAEPATDVAALRRALQEVVADKTGYPVEMVDPAMDLEADLGVDSIKRVQVIGALQERFPHLPSLGPEQLGTLRTLEQVATLLAGTETPAAASAPTSAASASGATTDELRRALQEVVADKTGYPVEMVDPAMDLEADLGVDSIKRVQVIGALQERFPHLPSLGPEQLGTLRTLDQVADALGGPAAPGVAPADGLSADELRSALTELVAEKTGYPVEMVDPAMDLEADLGVDSIKRVQVIGALQERYPDLPSLGPEQLGTLRTLDLIAARLADLSGGDADPKAEAAAGAPRHAVELITVAPVDALVDPYPAAAFAVVLGIGADTESDCAALVVALRELGWTVRRTTDLDTLAADPVDAVVVVAGAGAEWQAAQDVLTETIVAAGRAVPVLRQATQRAAFVTVTRLDGELGYRGDRDPVSVLLGGIGGVVKTVAAEEPALFCRALDIDPAVDAATAAARVVAELFDAATDTAEIGIDAAGVRRAPVPSRHASASTVTWVDPDRAPDPTTLSADDVLLVTGGGRGVTALCVLALAERSPARFVLLGRTELTPEPEWAAGVADSELKTAAVRALAGTGITPREIDRNCAEVRAVREIRATLAALGDRAEYAAADVTDAAAVRAAVEPWRDTLTGIVHGAGVLADSMIADKTAASVTRVLRPKLAGLAAALAVVARPRHLVLFTSVAGLFGNAGQADYAAANEALCRFATSWRTRHPDCHCVAIDWGAWDGGMVTPELRHHFLDRGIPLLAPETGATAFAEQFTPERRADTVVLVGEAVALSSAAPAPAPARVRRVLAGLTEEPVIAAHRIGEHIVLPATFALGALINVTERRLPGFTVTAAHDFEVVKGIVFDHPVDEVDIVVEPADTAGDSSTLDVRMVSGRTTHYRATLVCTRAADGSPRVAVPSGPGADAAWIYRDGVQFHGPALQGVRRVHSASDSAMVFECALPATRIAAGSYGGRLHDPVCADLILQCPPVLGHRLLGAACLPLGIGKAEYYRRLPTGEPFLVVVDNPRGGSFDITIDATATDLNGTVLQRFSGVTVVTTPDLTEKFRTSVRQWQK
ncbi:SDR family NAD(P)-dependent oxidoreductase [Nocardia macrotermitis]|uniref:Acyl carrier protein n=1 Tax=Nocardia macrotermitis TaxID=2585198 RepID=A0A7K0CUK1_9NOCA|nr:SDR family NAD(P)-dependent oxidoreductase [Nocardia macrotermitis]MQY17156.1 Acyl carrier protein [Nocardia macrotermitis]